MTKWAALELPPTNVIIVLGAMIGVLALGSLVRIVTLRSAPRELAGKRLASLRTWWWLSLLLTVGILCGPSSVYRLGANVS